ncbi:MAG: hypothetical protein AVDCRST_MAG96-2938 [uncultured Segetibacter sp.]|uniref:TonB C-terminal domain-containing protein n=1 Tax=uncultured Segetibacter sp. TaxID=481133 RepID=A0A6J4TEL5_9BACT|nr:MAG: hypothetical protein AVDCRST_MAG96-2938 [uncultured Segetibacter sp.]
MPLKTTAWWKVAAVVLTVVTGGILTYTSFNKTGGEKNVAQQMAPRESAEMATKTDSIEPVEKPFARVEVPNKELLHKRKTTPIIREGKAEPVGTVDREQMKADSVAIGMQENAGSSAFMDRNADAAATLKAAATPDTNPLAKKIALPSALAENEFKGKVLNEDGLPLPSVAIYAPTKNLSTTTDSGGSFTLKAADTALRLITSLVGYVPVELIIKRNSQANIILTKGESTLSEVVDTALSVKEKRKFNRVGSKGNSKKEAEPEGGWENFEQYLSRHIDSLKESDTNKYYNQNIELEFFIDSNGGPTSIKALGKADSIAKGSAIQLLLTGPKWKSRKKGEKVKVIIPFE